MSARNRIVVAGCGAMANLWLDYAVEREDAEIVALVDLVEEHAARAAARRGLQVPIFTDLTQALATVDANLLFDVTVSPSHSEVARMALQAGCHVFGEKPMAYSRADAEAVVEVARRTGKRYAIMQNRRYLRPIRALRDFLRSGGIGTAGSIHADFFLAPHFGNFLDHIESPLLLEMAIHTFDQARFITGADAVSVYCHEYNPPGSWYRGDAAAVCLFEMSDGSLFSYRGSWCAEGLNTSWEAGWRVTGSRGSVVWDGRNHPVSEVVDESQPVQFSRPVKRVEVPPTWQGREGHQGCLDEMFASLQEGRPAETEYTDNIKSVAMVFGALESARQGRKVRL